MKFGYYDGNISFVELVVGEFINYATFEFENKPFQPLYYSFNVECFKEVSSVCEKLTFIPQLQKL